jgi:catechol 2,3-dioxygenase-like lactoylglutathione lyase family enzyme
MAFNMRERDVDTWRAHLTEKGVPIVKEIKWPQGGYSLYFHDPAGNYVELATSILWGIPED